jgi:hypothetical protein
MEQMLTALAAHVETPDADPPEGAELSAWIDETPAPRLDPVGEPREELDAAIWAALLQP